jgi:hypothetical protein
LEKDFEELVTKRCAEAMQQSEEYAAAGTEDPEMLLDIATRECYIKGFYDALNVICSQKCSQRNINIPIKRTEKQ